MTQHDSDLCGTKLHSPSAAENAAPILKVLQEVLHQAPPGACILELGSGTGQHAALFSKSFPAISWQPSDVTNEALQSVRAHIQESKLSNLMEPIFIDIIQGSTLEAPMKKYEFIYCCNVIHITPWKATLGLLEIAQRCLAKGGKLITYGPYLEKGSETALSNVEFDQHLKLMNPDFGLRLVEDIVHEAEKRELTLERKVKMPRDNLMLILRKC